jgi:predicted TIM-barrel fold metal-dependent hydrolase
MNPNSRFPVIDAHVHVHPRSAPAIARLMDRVGLERIVNLGILEALDIPFDEGMSAFRAALGDRLLYFPTPDFRDVLPGFGARMAETLARKVERGAVGLKIFKELGLRHKDDGGNLIAVDDERLAPLWDMAGQLGVPVLIHTADPVAFFQPLDEHNERQLELSQHPDWYFGGGDFPTHAALMGQLEHVLARHPGTTFIGAHVGSDAEDLGYVGRVLDHYPNYYVDTTARVGEIGRHPAAEARAFFIQHQDRILFGTDLTVGWDAFAQLDAGEDVEAALSAGEDFYAAHWRFFETADRQFEYPGYPVQGDWLVDALNLPVEVLKKLYAGNVTRLLKI